MWVWIVKIAGAVWSQPAAKWALAGVALYAWAYLNGKSDATTAYARASAKAAQEWAEKIAAAKDQSFQDGLEAARLSGQNKQKSEEIGNAARQEPGAGDQCLSGSVYERLRDLR